MKLFSRLNWSWVADLYSSTFVRTEVTSDFISDWATDIVEAMSDFVEASWREREGGGGRRKRERRKRSEGGAKATRQKRQGRDLFFFSFQSDVVAV